MSGKLGKAPNEIRLPAKAGVAQRSYGVSDADSALKAFLAESDDERSGHLLTDLLCEYAAPLAKEIITSKLGREKTLLWGESEGHDVDDVCNEVAIQLLNRLRRLKTSGGAEFLDDFMGYVAVSAYNACNHYLRQKYPDRFRLKNKLRYVLVRNQRFALWEVSGRWFCGLAEWLGEGRRAVDDQAIRAIVDDSELAGRSLTIIEADQADVRSFLETLFVRTKGPVEFDILVGELSSALPQTETVSLSIVTPQREAGAFEHAPVPAGEETDRVDQQLYLRRVWSEIEALPPRQRAALLLNLRDPQGQELLTLLIEARGANMINTARALGMSPAKLAELWGQLPIDDAQIAQELGVTRQQVINLRLAARRRLARKMNQR